MNDDGSWPKDKAGFRLRGMDITRIEAFTDAAFAFAVTLLVISTQSIPASYVELTDALAGIPAFAMSFFLIMVIWYAHWKWSRRFGLEDMPTIVLSGGLVLAVLILVYPLRYVNGLTVYYFSRGGITSGATIDSGQQLYDLFAIFGVAIVTVSLLIAALNVYAYSIRETLQLDDLERYLTRAEIRLSVIAAGIGGVSLLAALFTAPSTNALPGWLYIVLFPILGIYSFRTNKLARRMMSRS